MLDFLDVQDEEVASKSEAKEFFKEVYAYMFMALVISGVVYWYFASSGLIIEWFVNMKTHSVRQLYYVVMFSPLALVFFIQLSSKNTQLER